MQINLALRGLTFEISQDSWITWRAVEHGLLIVTEAAKALLAELKATHPEIPWRQLEAFGNFLRHEYQRVDPQTLWRIATVDLKALEPTARAMLAALGEEP